MKDLLLNYRNRIDLASCVTGPQEAKLGNKNPVNTFLDTFSSPKPTKASKPFQCLLIPPSVHELSP